MKMRPRLNAAAALALMGGAAPFAHADGYGPWHGMMDGWGWHGAWGFGMVGMLLWWVLIVFAIALLAKWIFGGRGRDREGGSSSRALEILKERYARGEIGKDEYEQKKRDLGQ